MKKHVRMLWLRITTGFKLLAWGFMHPLMMRENYFKCISSIMDLLLKAAVEHRPMMSRLALVHMEEQHEVLSIWVGVGVAAHPMRRIEDLLKENEELRFQLSECVKIEQAKPIDP